MVSMVYIVYILCNDTIETSQEDQREDRSRLLEPLDKVDGQVVADIHLGRERMEPEWISIHI